MITAEQVRERLEEVLDPELMIDIVNLGLIYDITVAEDGRLVTILMTLTTMGCPAFESMRQEIVERIETLGVEQVNVHLTFDPPWSKERMSEEAQTIFRYLF
ncbi:MAG TPA: metal-sulfur cluster assembly factor [Bacilli bacterium]|nr:metal-sulfur cluster assembly factor [Bacilli bacterium]